MPFKPGNKLGERRGKNKKTLEKEKANEIIAQRVSNALQPLLDAQIALAKGQAFLFKIEGKGKKREHVLVTDSDKIRRFLDECDGVAGTMDENYYYITTEKPNNMAIDSLLNRAFGKPIETVEHQGDIILKIDL